LQNHRQTSVITMGKRTKRAQSKHDAQIKKTAKELENQGWDVKADIKGYEKPAPIGKDNRIPDIEAHKAGAGRIYEFETPETVESDKAQRATFKRSASQKKRTSYHEEVVE
jgi:hypothetical protein